MTVEIISGSQLFCRRIQAALKAVRLSCRQFRSVRAYLVAPPPPTSSCIILDINSGKQECLSSIERLRRKGVFHPVVVAAKSPTVPQAVEACKAGAADFIESSLPDKEWVSRIQAVLEAARRQNATVTGNGRPSLKHCGLTPREVEVLHHLADGHDSSTVAAMLKISLRTVEGYRSSIKQRTGAKTLAQLIRLVMEAEE
jgi:two-component system response regulator FixJ